MQASLYSQYLLERTEDLILESDKGFATYRYLDQGKTVYIVDIYVIPSARKGGWAAQMADEIVRDAKKKGVTKLIGSVVPSTRNATTSMKVLLGYGMTLDSSTNNFILFKKDI